MKLLALVDGEPLLNRTLASLLDADVTAVVVVLSPGADLAAAGGLQHPRVHQVINPDPSRGMFSSIQSGLAASATAGGDPVLVLPADMPFVTPATIRLVADECARVNRPVVATHGGRRGHPLALPGNLVPGLLSATATGSLKEALASLVVDVTHLELDDAGVLRDVDVPADLA